MEKLFYLVDVNVMRNLDWIPLANEPYISQNICINFEDSFWFFLRKSGLRDENPDKFLWSIPTNRKAVFETACKHVGISIKEIDLHEQYAEYSSARKLYIPSEQDEIPTENIVNICSKKVPKIICGYGTTQIFLEHRIVEKDSFELYINSNEQTGHSIPHCHVRYKDKKNYCVLSLVNLEKLAPDGGLRNAVICEAQSILKEHLQAARKKWNEVNSKLKFKTVNGFYSHEYS